MIQVLVAGFVFAVASWLGALAGRAICRYKQAFADGPASVRIHPAIVAALGGCVGIGFATHGVGMTQLVTVALVVFALAACTVSDLFIGIVPDPFTIVPFLALVTSSALHGNYSPLISATIVAFPFAGAALVSHGRGMGWGDVKLAALGGALLGARDATFAITIACVAAFVISRAIGARGRPIPFAPYLVGGFAMALMLGAATA